MTLVGTPTATTLSGISSTYEVEKFGHKFVGFDWSILTQSLSIFSMSPLISRISMGRLGSVKLLSGAGMRLVLMLG